MGQVVLVSGTPGAGKSVLARPLAALLGLPLLSKDVIKETLFDVLGHLTDDDLASSRQLGGATMELLWRLAGECPAVVLEANFREPVRVRAAGGSRTVRTTRGGVLPRASGCCGRTVRAAGRDG